MASRQRPLPDPEISPEIEILIALLDEGYEKKAWHGPNLKGAIRGLSVEQAVWRPRSDRHSIAEHVLHAAYWKYVVRRRLRNEARGSFPLKGSNWFAVGPAVSQAEWKSHLGLLDAEHRALRQAVLELDADQLHNVPQGAKYTHLKTITGIADHDVYHAGQIQLLKRLQK
jgi:uncharacterized damage-inducible protein DinB